MVVPDVELVVEGATGSHADEVADEERQEQQLTRHVVCLHSHRQQCRVVGKVPEIFDGEEITVMAF